MVAGDEVDVVAGIDPENVVQHVEAVGAGLEADGVADRLVGRVADDPHAVRPVPDHDDAVVAVGVHEVAQHLRRVEVAAAAEYQTGGVAVHLVAVHDGAGDAVDADACVVPDAVVFEERPAIDAGPVPRHTVAGRLAAEERDARPRPVIVDDVVGHEHAAATGDAAAAVAVNAVAGHDNPLRRIARPVRRDAPGVAEDVAVAHDRRRAHDEDAGVVAAHRDALDQPVGPRQDDAAPGVVRGGRQGVDDVVQDLRIVVRVAHQDPGPEEMLADEAAVPYGEPVAVDAIGREHLELTAGDREMCKRHVVGTGHLDRVRAVDARAAVEHGGVDAGALDAHAAVVVRQAHVADQRVGAGVDVDDVAGTEVVGVHQRGQARHRPVRRLAATGVVPARRREHVARRGAVVDVEIVARVDDGEPPVGDVRRAATIVGAHPDQCRVALHARRPRQMAPAVPVERQPRPERAPRRAAIRRRVDVHRRRRHAGRTRRHHLDPRQQRAAVHLVDEPQRDPRAAGRRHLEVERRRLRPATRHGDEVEVIAHQRSLHHDVHDPLAGVDALGLREMQPQRVVTVGHRQHPRQLRAGVAAVPHRRPVDALRGRVRHAAEIDRPGDGAG